MNLFHFTTYAAEEAKISDLYNPADNFTPSSTSKLTDLINSSGFNIINLVFFIVGLLFFVNLVAAGWDFLLSSGDPKKVAVASSRLTNGLSGLAMAVSAYLIVKIVITILGIGTTI
jgi:hypothetical protein